MSAIIKTIRLIEDRYVAVDQFKDLIFDRDLGANEIDHIQKMVEKHYWIFGEQYHLVTAADPKFEKALRRYIYLLRGEKASVQLDHKDKNKEMDIFAVRWAKHSEYINNVVVELKNPHVNLGEEQVRQVKKYLSVVQSEPEFNGSNMTWDFYLVGNKFDRSKYIEGEIENAKQHGERSLIYAVENKRYKIFVKTWSEVFAEFELRHAFLLEQLKMERDQLSEVGYSADEIIENQECKYSFKTT